MGEHDGQYYQKRRRRYPACYRRQIGGIDMMGMLTRPLGKSGMGVMSSIRRQDMMLDITEIGGGKYDFHNVWAHYAQN